MGEVVRFVPKSERERIRLIREARTNYDNIFPPTDPFREAPEAHTNGGVNGRRGDGASS